MVIDTDKTLWRISNEIMLNRGMEKPGEAPRHKGVLKYGQKKKKGRQRYRVWQEQRPRTFQSVTGVKARPSRWSSEVGPVWSWGVQKSNHCASFRDHLLNGGTEKNKDALNVTNFSSKQKHRAPDIYFGLDTQFACQLHSRISHMKR